MMRALLALCAIAVATSGCRIGDNLPETGEECFTTLDCKNLSCVPADPDDANGPRVCMPPPDGWNCSEDFLGDPDKICDCGCGALDFDCADDSAASCTLPDGDNCPSGQDPVADDNTRCE